MHTHRSTPVLALAKLLATICLIATSAPATDYYVNGATGTDSPTAGATVFNPWKTISYALSRVGTPAPGTTHTIWVAERQVYSVTTNGETFPLMARPDVSIVGTSNIIANYPIIRIPSGATGVQFDRATSFERPQTTLRNLTFRNGEYAIRMGADPAHRHRPRVLQCEFYNQTRSTILAESDALIADNPLFVQCNFFDGNHGITARAVTDSGQVVPVVEECTFRNMTGTAIEARDTSGLSTSVGALITNCIFRSCGMGISAYSTVNVLNTSYDVRRCFFRNMRTGGIRVRFDRPGDPDVRIEDCAFYGGQFGVRLEGTVPPGTHTLRATNNYFDAAGSGLTLNLNGQGDVTVTTGRNTARFCATGFNSDIQSAQVNLQWTSEQDRAFDGSVGWFTNDLGGPGGISIQNGILASHSNVGLRIAGSRPLTGRFLTIADNATGLLSTSTGHTLNHLVFDNTLNVVAPGQPITHSCFRGSSRPGAGNLSADPQLVRPHYTLGTASPCIDAGNAMVQAGDVDFEGTPRAMPGSTGGAAIVDLGADEYALDGSTHVFGVAGFGYATTTARISTPQTTANLNSTLQVDLTGAIDLFGNAANSAVVMLGDSEVGQFRDLTPNGAPGNGILQNTVAVGPLGFVSGGGTASFTTTIPNSPSLVGQPFLFQWAVFSFLSNQAGIVTSDGLRVTVGR